MWASGCRNCNLTLAERAFFCRLFFDFFLCMFQFFCKSVHNFHHNEYNRSKFIPPNNPRIGLMISSTRDDTILVNAPPIMIPTAMSMTLPRLINSLNSMVNAFFYSTLFVQNPLDLFQILHKIYPLLFFLSRKIHLNHMIQKLLQTVIISVQIIENTWRIQMF